MVSAGPGDTGERARTGEAAESLRAGEDGVRARAGEAGEAGVAGPTHALRASVPWSWSTLQLRADAWRHVAASLRAAAAPPSAETRALVEALGQGAAVRSRSG